jgi:hypothetical protein
MKITKQFHYSNSFLCQEAESKASFIELKLILDIFLHRFLPASLHTVKKSSSPHTSCATFNVCTQLRTQFSIFHVHLNPD